MPPCCWLVVDHVRFNLTLVFRARSLTTALGRRFTLPYVGRLWLMAFSFRYWSFLHEPFASYFSHEHHVYKLHSHTVILLLLPSVPASVPASPGAVCHRPTPTDPSIHTTIELPFLRSVQCPRISHLASHLLPGTSNHHVPAHGCGDLTFCTLPIKAVRCLSCIPSDSRGSGPVQTNLELFPGLRARGSPSLHSHSHSPFSAWNGSIDYRLPSARANLSTLIMQAAGYSRTLSIYLPVGIAPSHRTPHSPSKVPEARSAWLSRGLIGSVLSLGRSVLYGLGIPASLRRPSLGYLSV